MLLTLQILMESTTFEIHYGEAHFHFEITILFKRGRGGIKRERMREPDAKTVV